MNSALNLYRRQYDAKIIPVVMGFKYVNGAPIDRIIKTSKYFAKTSGGNFGVFIWDGDSERSIETSIRNSAPLEQMSKEITAE